MKKIITIFILSLCVHPLDAMDPQTYCFPTDVTYKAEDLKKNPDLFYNTSIPWFIKEECLRDPEIPNDLRIEVIRYHILTIHPHINEDLILTALRPYLQETKDVDLTFDKMYQFFAKNFLISLSDVASSITLYTNDNTYYELSPGRKCLDLHGRYIADITSLQEFPFIKEINERLCLQKNLISSLPKGIFSGLSIKDLDLSNNIIRKIERNAFAGLDELEILNLGCNKINDIEEGAFQELPKLRRICLHENPLDQKTIDRLRTTLKNVHIRATAITK